MRAETNEWPAISARATDPQRRAADLTAAAVFDKAIAEQRRRLRAMTLATERHDAEQRLRSVNATTRAAEASAIEGVTDTENHTATAEVARQGAERSVGRLLADAPAPRRGRGTDPTPDSLRRPQHEADSNERRYDNDHGV